MRSNVPYATVANELRSYSANLLERPQIIALTKVEGLDEEIIDDLMTRLRNVVPRNVPLYAISAQSGTGLQNLLFAVKDATVQARKRPSKHKKPAATVPVHTLAPSNAAWTVERDGDTFIVRGSQIEHFAARTDFTNEEAVQRLRDIMRKNGIMHELIRQGIGADQRIVFPNGASLEY